MKKIITFTIFILVSISLFASSAPSLLVNLDLTANKVEYFGVTSIEPKTLTDDFDTADDLRETSNQPVDISSSKDDPNESESANFWVWWYLYTPNKIKVNFDFTALKSAKVGESVDYTILDNSDSTPYTSSATEKYLVKDLTAATSLVYGYKGYTITPFDLRTLTIAEDYSSTITISIISIT